MQWLDGVTDAGMELYRKEILVEYIKYLRSGRMNKTIKVKKEFTFRELMEYIFENDVAGKTFVSISRQDLEDKYIAVTPMGKLNFNNHTYNTGETYEVEVEEEITEDMEFRELIEVIDSGDVFVNDRTSIKQIRTESSRKFYILLDGELVKIWERE